MTNPEWTTFERGLQSRRTAQNSLAAVLIGLAVLGGIGLGIPIGREQQARVDAQRSVETQQRQDEQSGNAGPPRDWLSTQDGGAKTAPEVLLPLPDVTTVPADLQRVFNQFHCAAADGASSMQCAALAVLRTDSRFEPGSASAPALTPGRANGTYTEGQEITLAVKASSEFDGYLYVDCFDSEGNVYHLRPSRKSEGDPLKAAAWIELGGRSGERYIASPPFGADLVVAISLSQPLFGLERPLQAPAARYFTDLHERLQQVAHDSGVTPVSAYTTVVTFPRGSAEL